MSEYFAFFGHHKCATKYVTSILTDICSHLRLSKIEFSNSRKFENDLLRYLENKPHNFIFYTNAKYEFVEPIINNTKGFHLIRDPRDIVVSGYFSHLYSHPTDNWPELNDYRDKLKSCNQKEGLLLETEYCSSRFLDLYNWNYDNHNILELKFEDLIKNPYANFIEIMEHLELLNDDYQNLSSIKYSLNILHNNLTKKFFNSRIVNKKLDIIYLLQMVNKRDFQKLSKGRKPGLEDVNSHYRMGISGDYKNYFDNDIKMYFKDKYGDVLIKLGYERNNDW